MTASAFTALDVADVTWAVLRGADGEGHGDIDLLVASQDTERLAEALTASGFIEVSRPGHGTHRFFVGYDETTCRWVELDVISRLAYGRHQELDVTDASVLLRRRRRDGGHWTLDPSDDFWALLLHYALDRKAMSEPKRGVLSRRAGEARAEGPVAAQVAVHLPDDGSLDDLLTFARQRRDDTLDSALADLADEWWRKHRGAAVLRATRDRVQARVRRAVGNRGSGLVVAFLGPDGAGKSTLIASLRETWPCPTETFYMGVLRTTDLARRLRRIPGLMLAGRLLQFGARAAAGRYHASRGRLVLFDRYSYDAFLPVARAGLRGRVSSALILRACPPPDLTVVLDAPAEVMFARKGELGEVQLADFRRRYLALHERVAGMVVLDASKSAVEVHAAVTKLIWQTLTSGTAA